MIVVVGLAVEIAIGVAYVVAARIVSSRRRPWPISRTAAFLGGLSAIAIVVQSPFAAHDDDVFWVHLTQHVVLMSVAPILLVLGAPVTLALLVLKAPHARRLVGVLRSHPIQALCGRAGAGHLLVDYYGLMFVYFLTPAAALSARSQAFHVTMHALFFTCGLLFWTPIIGPDPTAWKPTRKTKVAFVAAGIPANAALAAATGSWTVLIVTEAATVFGLIAIFGHMRTGLFERWWPVRAGRSVAVVAR